MDEDELLQFRSLVNWITGFLIVALVGRLSVAEMPPMALFISWAGIISASLVSSVTGRFISLAMGKKIACALGYGGLTLVIAYNGGMDAPAIVFLPAASMAALFVVKPKRIASGILLACAPFICLIALKAYGLQPPAIIVAEELRFMVHCFWGLLGTGLIAVLFWRVWVVAYQQGRQDMGQEIRRAANESNQASIQAQGTQPAI